MIDPSFPEIPSGRHRASVEKASLRSFLRLFRIRGKVGVTLAVSTLIVGFLGLATGDQFDSIVSAHFDRAITDQVDVDSFVSTVVERRGLASTPVVGRVIGPRIQTDTSIAGPLGAFDVNPGDRSGDAVLDRSDPGHGFRVMTTRCPGNPGHLIPMYFYLRGDVDSGEYARLTRTGGVELDGMWDIDPVHTEYDGSFCTVDLRLVRA
jgi:hypothetical protein